ncbi:CBN-TAG-216 protein [Caenorhabditis brenneri]|uniref:Actin-interacting protein 1 n=1 Tax=Caenorhabditis brenneri TaxID=135651 RepID=G0PKQ0_CAEBE|nr:CBN-TAG-216 protein [Caenorhabditis brenneri]
MSEFSLTAVFPSLPRTTRGSPVVLGTNPAGDKIQYCNGNSVYTIPLDTRSTADIYTEHTHPTTVAKTSPSGFYCASGDTQGNVRIWDTTQATHILKHTIPVFSGMVKDIAWDAESKRIAAVGEGRERFGHVFLLDTTTSNGSLTGQSRTMNSVDFKPTRPFRIVSGADDNSVAIFEGPPFKFKSTFHHHSKFVQSTRYSPDGTLFASCGSDGLVILYNGVDGEKIGVLEDTKGTAHSGTVFALSWSPDGSRIATASADKTVKIWDVSSKTLEKTIVMGTKIEDQQLGVLWTKAHLVSVSANGFLNFLNPDEGSVVDRRQGHNKGITALTKSQDSKSIYSADAEGHITSWDVSTGESNRSSPHTTMITGIQKSSTSGDLYTVSWDDTLKITFGASTKSFTLPSQPLSLAVADDMALVACYKHVAVLPCGAGAVKELPIDFHSNCIAYSVEKGLVAVGGKDAKVHLYKISGDGDLEVAKVIEHGAEITSVSFSDNGEFLVATDLSRKVIPYSVSSDFAVASPNSWTFHTAKIQSVSWSPDNRRLATGSLDNSVIVWDMEKPGEHPVIIKGAHAMSSVNAVLWLDSQTVVSAGQDSNIKIWNVPV